MKKITGVKRVNTFLIEIIIVLLFFSLSIPVALNFFVSAHNKQQKSEEVTNFSFICQSLIAKTINLGDTFISDDILKDAYSSDVDMETATAFFYYNEQFQLVHEPSLYKVELVVKHASNNTGTMATVSAKAFIEPSGNAMQEKLIDFTSKKYFS